MKFLKTRAAVSSVVVGLLLLIVGLYVTFLLVEGHNASAASGDVEKAKAITDVLVDALVAAVVSVSDAAGDQAGVEAGSAVVSILVPESQDTYRLIDATGDPLDGDNVAEGNFEASALAELVATGGFGETVQDVVGNQLRTLVALTNDAHSNCQSCHTNYGSLPAGTVVGALSLRVNLP